MAFRVRGMRVRHEGLERECVVKDENENNGHRGLERLTSTGIGGEEGPPGGEAPAKDG